MHFIKNGDFIASGGEKTARIGPATSGVLKT
jgi:hypothetical protein